MDLAEIEDFAKLQRHWFKKWIPIPNVSLKQDNRLKGGLTKKRHHVARDIDYREAFLFSRA